MLHNIKYLLVIFHSGGYSLSLTLRRKCPYSELFWSVFSRTRAEYGEILVVSPYSVQMRENDGQNNSEYGHFLRSVIVSYSISSHHGVIILSRSNNSVFLYLKVYWNREVFDLICASGIWMKPEMLRYQASSSKF